MMSAAIRRSLVCATAVLGLLLCFALPFTAADESTSPYILTGSEPQLANNLIITIDDCSIEFNVRWAFNLLKNRGLKAVFFPNTLYINKQDPQLWRDIVAAGFEIGYHTRLHMRGLTPKQLTEDFTLYQQELRTILDNPTYQIRYIRPPGGVWNKDWLAWGAANHLITVKWNVVAPNITMPYVYGVIHNRVKGGSILLMHTGKADLNWLQKNISTLMRMKDGDGKPYIITTLTAALDD